ncbi:SIR2 family protein [Mycetocola sp. JXN-3]|uniref:SIR2 family protein n=1 Tax=Mycetocola sp. JXN-3 TaxID=2116510 RepID=UPI00165D13F0|nr:SIR2 family protein [Mycetocola sp. JXN-3]
MSAPDLTPAIMAQFAASGADKHLTLLLGAGASVASGLPDWNELAVRLLLRSGAVRDRRLAELLVREQDPLLVAEAAKQSLGSEWEASVRQALYSAPESPSPSTLHFAVAQHMLEGAHSNTTLITLNFDTLLEQALRVVSLRESRLLGPLAGECFEASVHHLHGVVGSGHVRDLVLTLTDYNEILSAGLSWQQALLRHSLRQGAVLIVGTTYRDPDVRK